MIYHSTRGGTGGVTAPEAIAKGLSGDGGLYVPQSFPHLKYNDIEALKDKTYSELAAAIMKLFLDEFSIDELTDYASRAYRSVPGAGRQIFYHGQTAPVRKTDAGTYFLELWHGPTAAFKDIALQVMPKLLTASLKKTGEKREVCILAATSGDTGKAALEGFRDTAGTRIMVFYPKDGVSEIQRLQMTTQEGSNVNVTAVQGNFDDTQRGVKKIFSDKHLEAQLGSRGFILSSANSINWGRLVPQIAYYFYAYCNLLKSNEIKPGEEINFCVPTGNFGNILAAYYAKTIGLPAGKLICASNRNDVLTRFINTGVYDSNRAFYATMSPSMDILISSNLERLLFELSQKDGGIVASYMSDLSESGRYEVPPSVFERIARSFAAGYSTEEDTMSTIASVWNEHGYLIDPHTAVAGKVLHDYREKTGDTSKTVIVSTASPFKFAENVLKSLGRPAAESAWEAVSGLSAYCDVPVPMPLTGLGGKKERFSAHIEEGEMSKAVTDFLKG